MNATRRFSLDDALRTAVEALGGLQVVGHAMRPELDPITAGQWLSHCMTEARRDKLSSKQIDLIFDRAAAIGAHEGIQGWCRGRGAGYTATPTAPEVALQVALEHARAAQHDAEQSAHDLQTLIDNPRLVAQMRAAHLKVDA